MFKTIDDVKHSEIVSALKNVVYENEIPEIVFYDKDLSDVALEIFYYIQRSYDILERKPNETLEIAFNLIKSGRWRTPKTYNEHTYSEKPKVNYITFKQDEITENEKEVTMMKLKSLKNMLELNA